MSHLQALPEGTELVSDFRIERVLGAGGFGITYLAREIALDRKVTIKEYFPSDFAMRGRRNSAVPRSEDCQADYQWGLERFIDEAQTLARFDHPNIVRVYRYFRANNTGYLVMHFEEGHSLKSWLLSLGRAPRQAELDRIIAPMLEALSVVHAAEFLHRDIAPDNIIIRTDGSPVLIDFGAARGDIAQHSRTVSALVKPGYSPYEQYGEVGRQQGPWTDIYALAATLYHAVTGKRPPDAPSRVMKDEYLSARDAALSAYRPTFLKAIDRGLRIDIEKRPQSIAEWRGELLAPDMSEAARGWFGAKRSDKVDTADLLDVRSEAFARGATRPLRAQAATASGVVPPPPDVPGQRGRIVDFLDGVRQTPHKTVAAPSINAAGSSRHEDAISAALMGLKKGDQAAVASDQAGSKNVRGGFFGFGRVGTAKRDKAPTPEAPGAEVVPSKAKKPAARELVQVEQRSPPRPRQVRSKSRWRLIPIAAKLAVGIVIAASLVRLQQAMPQFEFRSSSTLASSPSMAPLAVTG
ncbi:MAG: serine/threonine protein kinase, partial [Alphaproteobacteria bacterium]|nr:serine/threonine protein kinase [Alphaproteobacteria bacterium]